MSQADREVLDASFQELKGYLSTIIDGQGGSSFAVGSFNDIPMFLSYAPDIDIGADAIAGKTGQDDLNLYTGYGHAGFSSLPLLTASDLNTTGTPQVNPTLTGTASAGTTTTITLDESASAIPDVYRGMQIAIDGGTGSGQTATIASYNGTTRVATLATTLTTAPDATSTYTLDSGQPNYSLVNIGSVTSVRFAEHVWGADSYRMNFLTDDITQFKPLTQDEIDYRAANSIPASDLDPKTAAEKQLRRELSIFDPEYGTVHSQKNAVRMTEQVNNAIEQITIMMTSTDAKLGSLRDQYTHGQLSKRAQETGIDALRNVDPFEASAAYRKLTLDAEKILGLAARLTENIRKLNDLVHSRGTR